jgi:hypothetical protein
MGEEEAEGCFLSVLPSSTHSSSKYSPSAELCSNWTRLRAFKSGCGTQWVCDPKTETPTSQRLKVWSSHMAMLAQEEQCMEPGKVCAHVCVF